MVIFWVGKIRALRAELAVVLALALLAGFATQALAQGPPTSDMQAQVHEALYQEIYGRNDLRQQQLEALLVADPDLAVARWHLGQLNIGGQWNTVDDVISTGIRTGVIAQYDQRRGANNDSVQDHRELAVWCQDNELADRSRYHWQQVLERFPNHLEARRALEAFYAQDGSLSTRDQVLENQDAQRKARRDAHTWQRPLTRNGHMLLEGNAQQRNAARTALLAIEDPSCIESVEAMYSDSDFPQLQLIATEIIANIQGTQATLSLVRHALYSPSTHARNVAAEALQARSLYEFAPTLLAALQPIFYCEATAELQADGSFAIVEHWRYVTRTEIYLTTNPVGTVAANLHEAILRNAPGQANKLNLFLNPHNEPIIALLATVADRDDLTDPVACWQWWNEYNALQPQTRDETRVVATASPFRLVSENRLSSGNWRQEIAGLDNWTVANHPSLDYYLPVVNGKFYVGPAPARYIIGTKGDAISEEETAETLENPRFVDTLVGVTPGTFVYDSYASPLNLGQPWQIGTFVGLPQEPVARYIPPAPPRPTIPFTTGAPDSEEVAEIAHHSCFAAGTPVWTDTGMKPIEDFLPGDRVLTQDVETGELSFKLVTGTTVSETPSVCTVVIAEEAFIASPGHQFWVSGAGWKIARDLTSGDILHGLQGAYPVSEVIAEPETLAVYNLIVEDDHNYFVGHARILVHDVTIHEGTQTIVPGLAENP